MPYLLLTLDIALATGRNLLSKRMSDAAFGTSAFFLRQCILFGFGALALLLFGDARWHLPAPQTILFAVFYALLLIGAQWCYTVALGGGGTALCSTVYSMGFILPTLFGFFLGEDAFSVWKSIGIVCAVATVLCAGISPKRTHVSHKTHFFLPLLAAMLSSGGLGILQKLWQTTPVASEKTSFLLLAFLLATGVSAIAACAARRDHAVCAELSSFASAAGIGIAFGSCNLLNTALAGMLPGLIFFPTLNIGTILLSLICGVLIYRDPVRKSTVSVLLLGAASILLITFG